MAHLATKSVTIHPINGRPFNIVAGQQLTPGQYNKLSARQQQDYTTLVVKTNKRVRYTKDEAIELVGLYVSCKGNEKMTVASYLDMNPMCNHTISSIQQAVRQLSAIDPNKGNDTKWIAKTVFIETAIDIASDYFDPNGDLQDAYYLA